MRSKAKNLILFQSRGNIFSSPGADTLILTALKKELKKRDFLVDFSAECLETNSYDLVHIFGNNNRLGVNAAKGNTPIVFSPDLSLTPEINNESLIFLSLLLENRDTPLAELDKIIMEEIKDSKKEFFIRRDFSNLTLVPSLSSWENITSDNEALDKKEILPLSLLALGDEDGMIGPEIRKLCANKKSFVLIPGQLSPELNQYSFLKLIDVERFTPVFATLFSHDPRMVKLLKKSMDHNPIFLSELKPKELHAISLIAEAVLSASFLLEPSLEELIALKMAKRRIVPNERAYREIFGDNAHYISPKKLLEAREVITQTLVSAELEEKRLLLLPQKDELVNKLSQLYGKLIGAVKLAGFAEELEVRRVALKDEPIFFELEDLAEKLINYGKEGAEIILAHNDMNDLISYLQNIRVKRPDFFSAVIIQFFVGIIAGKEKEIQEAIKELLSGGFEIPEKLCFEILRYLDNHSIGTETKKIKERLERICVLCLNHNFPEFKES